MKDQNSVSDKKKVSVVMPVYNAKEYISQAIDSMVNQTYPLIEIIIIDDGSSDGTAEILDWYDAKYRNIFVYRGPNRGIVYSLNKGISLSSGDYIARMDADDISFPERIELQVAYMESNLDVGACGTFSKYFGGSEMESYRPVGARDCALSLLFLNPIIHPSVIIRASVIKVNNILYREEYKHAEDYKFFTEISRVAKIENLPLILLWYRIHDGQLTNVVSGDVKSKHMVIALENFKNAGFKVERDDIERIIFPENVSFFRFFGSFSRVFGIFACSRYQGKIRALRYVVLIGIKHALKTKTILPLTKKYLKR